MLLEVCVEDCDGMAAAAEGGAERIELCAALDVGGLTPPPSLIRAALAQPLPVQLLIRPRSGDFCYSPAERDLVAADIAMAAEAGLAGIVIGATREGAALDTGALAAWISHARACANAHGTSLSLTLHRAFDMVINQSAALEQAIVLGFERILTSGGAAVAPEAQEHLIALHRQAAERIIIMPGSGIKPANVAPFVVAGFAEIHASCSLPTGLSLSPDLDRLGFGKGPAKKTSALEVRRLRTAIDDVAR